MQQPQVRSGAPWAGDRTHMTGNPGMQVYKGTAEDGEVVAYKVQAASDADVEACSLEAAADCRSCIKMHAYLVSSLCIASAECFAFGMPCESWTPCAGPSNPPSQASTQPQAHACGVTVLKPSHDSHGSSSCGPGMEPCQGHMPH